MNLRIWVGCFLGIMLMLTGCDTPLGSKLLAKMEECQVMGVVRDEKGNPIDGVTITSGRENLTTNVRGVFSLNRAKVENDRCVLSFKKEGYCSVTRSCAMNEKLQMDVVMLSKESQKNVYTQAKFRGANEISVGKMKVLVPERVVDKFGLEYKGEVTADVFYLDPNNSNFQSAMPGGDLEAVRSDNSSAFLKSYGMVDVTLTDDKGNALQLAEDAEAYLTFPVPAGMTSNTPEEIPLWAFNENKGVWEEEGVALYDATEKVYKGKVKHFSWHNLDVPSERVTLKGKVTDCNGDPVEGVKVIVGQTSGYTDKNGEYSVYIPKNTEVEVYVRSSDYYNYKEGKRAKVAATDASEVEAPLISLPCLSKLSGKIKNSCGDKPLALVYVDYTIGKDQFTSTPVWSNPNDGSFSICFPKNAASLLLHVESDGGAMIPRPFLGGTSDIDAGEVEVCVESQEKEVINVNYGDRSVTFNVNEQSLDVASDIGGFVGAITEIISVLGGEKIDISPRFITISSDDEQSVLSIKVKTFSQSVSTYDAEVTFASGKLVAKGTGFFTVVEHKDDKTLLTVSCALTAEKSKTPVTLSGMFSIPDMANGMKIMGSIAHVPESCPSFPKPILATFQYHIDGHWITGGVYKSLDYNSYKEKLLAAGAECIEEKLDGKSPSGVFYHKDYMATVSSCRILLMEKPTFKEKKSYTTQVMDGKSKVKADTDFEIDILESKAILQTISDDPVQLAIK